MTRTLLMLTNAARPRVLTCVLGCMLAILAALAVHARSPVGAEDEGAPPLRGRIVAVGIPGASAISPVGVFLPGGPIHDNPAFAAFTQPGRILDPARILVASRSNFGAPLARHDQRAGALLSIDPRGDMLAIQSDFAVAVGQASTLGGRVQLFSAQSPDFLNGINNPAAVTADFTGVSNPLGLSINNAFGRLWPANAPYGLAGIGTSSILDPTGIGLAGAPNAQAGGVFAGDLTPRLPVQVIPGALGRGAVGTAFLGHSPDGSTRAVFSVVLADGSLVQEHTGKAVDGLAPAGTVRPLIDSPDDDDAEGEATRVGVLFNWAPSRILYVTEPLANRIAALDLTDDGLVFRVAGVRRLHGEELNEPVDLAPVVSETTDPSFSSNTTLDENADFYVANRGNNTIVRMRQDGTVVAARRIRLEDGGSLGRSRLNGIAISPDARVIWVTVTGRLPGFPRTGGAVLELTAF